MNFECVCPRRSHACTRRCFCVFLQRKLCYGTGLVYNLMRCICPCALALSRVRLRMRKLYVPWSSHQLGSVCVRGHSVYWPALDPHARNILLIVSMFSLPFPLILERHCKSEGSGSGRWCVFQIYHILLLQFL